MRERRAASGESSIHRAADGRWHGYVSMGLKREGKRDRRHVSGLKRADVVAKVRELERKRESGTIRPAGRSLTTAKWLDHWIDNVAPVRLRPSTLNRYRQLVTLHMKPAIGHHRLDRLLPEHLEAMYAGLIARGYAPATVLQVHRVLSRALKVATKRGLIAQNMATVDAPSVQRDEVQPLTAIDARRVLVAAARRSNAARWSVALALGLRQGEALGLSWTAVDLDQGTLSVTRALQRLPWRHGCAQPDSCGTARTCPQRQGGGLNFVPPKSRAGRRTLVMPQPLVAALRAHRADQNRQRLLAGSLWEDHELVFCQPNGRPIDSRADNREWHQLLAAAGVRKARLHDARHTAATLLLQQGVSPRVAMEILGHSQITLHAWHLFTRGARAREGRRKPDGRRAMGSGGNHRGTARLVEHPGDDDGRSSRWAARGSNPEPAD